MEESTNKPDLSQYKSELASLKRSYVQLHELRKWLLNVSLASLAFAFTVMFQVKDDGVIPSPTLAGFSIAFLIFAVIGGLFIRGKDEFEKFVSDSIDVVSLLPVLQEMVEKSPESLESDRQVIARLIEIALPYTEQAKHSNTQDPRFMYADLYLIGVEFLLLALGLGSLCLYVWRYLFSA